MMRLKDRVAVVTGSSSGIGRAIALRLAMEGANVVVTAHTNVEGANKVADEIRALNRKAIVTKVDVANSREVNQMVKTALDEFGKVDILVNNAGGSSREKATLFYEATEEVWDFVIALNLKGVRNCSQAVINHMMQRQSGKIVNIGSSAGITGGSPPEGVDYAAAKAGVIGFTMALAKEVASYGVNVNCVSVGPIQTGRSDSYRPAHFKEWQKKSTGFDRRGKPEEIANMVAFLASDEASFITGQNYAVCGLRNLGGPF